MTTVLGDSPGHQPTCTSNGREAVRKHPRQGCHATENGTQKVKRRRQIRATIPADAAIIDLTSDDETLFQSVSSCRRSHGLDLDNGLWVLEGCKSVRSCQPYH